MSGNTPTPGGDDERMLQRPVEYHSTVSNTVKTQRLADISDANDTSELAREDAKEFARLSKLTDNERVKEWLVKAAYGAAFAADVVREVQS